MSQLGRIKPKYISASVTNLTTGYINATIDERYNIAPIQKLDNYVCAIERLELHTNGIPFYYPKLDIDNRENLLTRNPNQIEIWSKGLPGGDVLIRVIDLDENNIAYNLYDLFIYLESLNILISYPNDPSLRTKLIYLRLKCGLDPTGKISLAIYAYSDLDNQNLVPSHTDTSIPANTFEGWQYLYIQFPTYLNAIMGFNKDRFDENILHGTSNSFKNLAFSIGPRIDCGDSFDHILLTSTLPVISDTVETTETNVLTDIAKSSNYAVSVYYNNTVGGIISNPNRITPVSDDLVVNGGWTIDTRQKLIYVPNERRFLDLIAPFSMNYLRVDAYYVDISGNSRIVQLPPGGSFKIKIGFFMK